MDVLASMVFPAISMASVNNNLSIGAPIVDIMSGLIVMIVIIIISYYRSRLQLMLYMIKGTDDVVKNDEEMAEPNTVVKYGFILQQNLFPAAPLFFVISLLLGWVSYYLWCYAVIYLCAFVVEVIYGLYRYRDKLNVKRVT